MDAYTFAIQQRTFDVHGYALNPSTMGQHKPIVGSLNLAHQNGYLPADAMKPTKAVQRETKRKRKGKGDASVVDGDDAYMGPWAAYEVDTEKQIEVDDAEDGAEEWRAEKKRREEAQDAARETMKHAREEKTIFHGELCWLGKADDQERNCWIMRDGHICTSRPTWMSSSIRPKGVLHQTPICRTSAYIPG
jgi:pre-mRNA-processing factor 17